MNAEPLEEFEDADEDILDARKERARLSQSVVWATDWTVETILAQLSRGAIELSPRFQRRDAWTVPRKSRFIESLALGLPVPQIVLAERPAQRGRYIVLDGKQRLLSLLQFRGLATESKHNGFALSGLEVLQDDLAGKRFADLSSDPLLGDLHDAFVNQPIRSLVIRNWPDELFLHLVFLRLNTGSVQLSSQELRQAMFTGGFTDFVDDAARESKALQKVLNLSEPDFRMRDVEVMLRHLAFKHFLKDYRGELKLFLDEAARKLNAEWDNRSADLHADVTQFEAATEALITVFGKEHVARRPATKGRRPFNRAVFDVQSFYFSDEEVRRAAQDNPEAVRKAFENLWARDESFVRAVESTTKTVEATRTRYEAWSEALGSALGMKLPAPGL